MDLFGQIESLQSFIQNNIEKFNKKIIAKDNNVKKMSEIIELLQARSEQYASGSSEIDDKIRSNQLKIVKLNAKISSKNDDLENLLQKIGSFEMHLHQMEENFSSFNEEKTMRQEQLTKLFEDNEYLQLCNEKHSQEIQELHGKTCSIDNQLNTIIDLKRIIAMKNDELVDLFGKLNDFELRIRGAEENKSNLSQKLYTMYGVNAIFFIISTCFFIKGLK